MSTPTRDLATKAKVILIPILQHSINQGSQVRPAEEIKMEKSHCTLNCTNCPAFGASVFKDLDDEASKAISENKTSTHYKKGANIFHQGTPSFGTYCIEKGKVKLSKISESGGETILYIASPGELIGYQDLKKEHEYQTNATALEDSTACFISNNYFQETMIDRPKVALNLLNKSKFLMDKISSYGHASLNMNAKNRIANLLLALGDNFGIENNGVIRIELYLTRHELASMVGTATETIIRSISEFKQQGILEQEGNFLLIKDFMKLKEQSNRIN